MVVDNNDGGITEGDRGSNDNDNWQMMVGAAMDFTVVAAEMMDDGNGCG